MDASDTDALVQFQIKRFGFVFKYGNLSLEV